MPKKRLSQKVEDFGQKLGIAGAASSLPGMAIGDTLANNAALRAAGSVVKPLADIAVHHPYGAGIAGAVATGIAGVVGAAIHQRGMAVGRRQHLMDSADKSRQ